MYPSSYAMTPIHITPQVCMMHLSVEASNEACTSTAFKFKGTNMATHALGSSGRSYHLGRSSDGFLSEHELKEWTKWFSLPDREREFIEAAVSSVFEPTCRATLESLNSVPCAHGRNMCKKLNLSCWAHWQTAPIPHHIAGHSQRSVQLVSILNFIDHIHSTNGVGLNYEMEMKAFLNMDDVKPLVQEEKANRKRPRMLDDLSDEEGLLKQLKEPPDPYTVEPCYSNAQLSPSHSVNAQTPTCNTSPVNPSLSVDNEGKHTLVPQPPVLDSLDWLNDFDPSQLVTPEQTPQAHSATKKVTETHFKPPPVSLPTPLRNDTSSSSCSFLQGLSSKVLFGNEDTMDPLSEGQLRTLDTNVTVVAESDLDDEEADSKIAVPSPLSPKVEEPCNLSSVSHEDSFLLLHGNRAQRLHNPLMTPPSLQSAQRMTIKSPEQLFGAEINDFLDEEAEVSGSEGLFSDGIEDGQSGDEYEDSFINDNTFLTQYPSAGSSANKGTAPMGSRKRSSPTGPCRNRYRMVLSQRHTILSRLMKKDSECNAAAKKNRLDIHEGDEVVYDDHDAMVDDQQAMGDVSEAEEMFIEYGEEDREEFTCTQELPKEPTIVEEQVPERFLLSCAPSVVDSTVIGKTVIGKQCADDDVSHCCVVDSNLMVS